MTINLSLPKNWKTSLSGVLAAAAAFVMYASGPPFSMHFPTWLMALTGFFFVGGLAGLGIAAKDRNVTGGSVVQSGIPVAPVPPLALNGETRNG